MSREQAAYFVGSTAPPGRRQNVRISKQSLAYLISLLDKGGAKYYSCGAILCLMRFDKENVELFAGALNGARNIKNLADLMLAGPQVQISR